MVVRIVSGVISTAGYNSVRVVRRVRQWPLGVSQSALGIAVYRVLGLLRRSEVEFLVERTTTKMMLPRYLNSSAVFDAANSMELKGQRVADSFADWNKTSVLPRLMVRWKRLVHSATLSPTRWREHFLCTIIMPSSGKRVSRTHYFCFGVKALNVEVGSICLVGCFN